MTDRKHPSAAFWLAVALVAVLVGYPLSLGPLNWLDLRFGPSGQNEDASAWIREAIYLYWLPEQVKARKNAGFNSARIRAYTWIGGRPAKTTDSPCFPLAIPSSASLRIEFWHGRTIEVFASVPPLH